MISHPPGEAGSGSDRPIFIVGCARSGTTLLQLMLHAHPRIAIPPETRYLTEAYDRRGRFGDLRQPENVDALVDWITGTPNETKFPDLGIDADELRARAHAAEPTLGTILGLTLQLYAERWGKPRWGDKRPSYFKRLDALLDMFPDAQIIHLIRDGRDCVTSLKAMPWWGSGSIGAMYNWIAAMRVGARCRRRLPDDQFYELYYEDLVTDPRAELERFCAFLGEDFAEEMLEPGEVAGDAVPQRKRKRHHQRTTDAVSKQAVGRWAEGLEPWELRLMEFVAARPLRARLDLPPPVQGLTTGRTACSSGAADPQRWARIHFAKADLGHFSRTRRVETIAAAMANAPGDSIPQLFTRSYDVEAAYTFFDHPTTTPDRLQRGHRAWVHDQLAQAGTYLLLEDTTTVSFSHRRQPVPGLGAIGDGSEGYQGFYLHSVLALRVPDPTTLAADPTLEQAGGVVIVGLADQQYYIRTPRPEHESLGCGVNRRLSRPRESQRWLRATPPLGPATAPPNESWKREAEATRQELGVASTSSRTPRTSTVASSRSARRSSATASRSARVIPLTSTPSSVAPSIARSVRACRSDAAVPAASRTTTTPSAASPTVRSGPHGQSCGMRSRSRFGGSGPLRLPGPPAPLPRRGRLVGCRPHAGPPAAPRQPRPHRVVVGRPRRLDGGVLPAGAGARVAGGRVHRALRPHPLGDPSRGAC
jgi:hypothetical protein